MATQAERTAHTRERLLNATIESLVERGYRATSTPEICRRAGVSRGAQLHHYPNKELLVAAAVDHLLEERVAELGDRLSKAPAGVLDLHDAAEFLWSVYTGPTFDAWLELVVAARTDPLLHALVAELNGRLVTAAERLCGTFLLPYVDDPALVAATTRLILAIFDGLAMHRILCKDDQVARSALRVAAQNGLFTRQDKRA